jgi:imidazolonepropionase
MSEMNVMDNAWLLVEKGVIADFGCMEDMDCSHLSGVAEVVDASGRHVLPSFCDPHTHIVFAGSREKEFTDKINGLSYEEIARRGGGILNSARLLRKTNEDELFEQSALRVKEIMRLGTGAIEIKSGYGLDVENELKILRVIKRIRETFPVIVKSTLLGAHALPEEYRERRDAYVEMVISEMIPLAAAEDLADYIDVFCDKGFFTPEETGRILMAGLKYGLRAKIHANELGITGGVQVAVKYDALSVDHLEHMGPSEIECLLGSETMPTLLPGASFFLGIPYGPARKMIDSGLPLALASDYNPGSSPSGDMRFILSLACLKYKLTPTEALNAATLNAAYAMGIEDVAGTVSRGKAANLIITTKIPGIDYLPYAYTQNQVEAVVLAGKVISC